MKQVLRVLRGLAVALVENVDHYILGHRFGNVCQFITEWPWWREFACEDEWQRTFRDAG